MSDKSKNQVTRRKFLAGTAGTALAFTIIKPELAKGTTANSKINLGLIGCGARGTWIADLFAQHGGYNITACADYFQGQVDKFGEKFTLQERFSNSPPFHYRFSYRFYLPCKDSIAKCKRYYLKSFKNRQSRITKCHQHLSKS